MQARRGTCGSAHIEIHARQQVQELGMPLAGIEHNGLGAGRAISPLQSAATIPSRWLCGGCRPILVTSRALLNAYVVVMVGPPHKGT
jgi:hypothetical protein